MGKRKFICSNCGTNCTLIVDECDHPPEICPYMPAIIIRDLLPSMETKWKEI